LNPASSAGQARSRGLSNEEVNSRTAKCSTKNIQCSTDYF
jgi:hypothetical protein